jgi:3-isopropylmalate dehydrogenase
MRRTHTVACLAGDGIGPELMAEASRTLHSVAHVHGFAVEDVHVPFGTEAVTRSGHPLPAATRSAYLEAEAVLVASLRDPALQRVESELDLRARITRVVYRDGDFTMLSPLQADADEWAIDRAFAVARRSRGRLASVDEEAAWASLVDRIGRQHEGVAVRHLTVAEGLTTLAFEPERFDVVVTGRTLARTLEGIIAELDRAERVVAAGRLAENGPSVFAPASTDSPEIAGHGVADPSSMLLATSLMLAEGLGEQQAAETLVAALASAKASAPEPASPVEPALAASTRELADAVLDLLHVSHSNAEFMRAGCQG